MINAPRRPRGHVAVTSPTELEQLFNESYERVIGLRGGGPGRDRFFDRFYELFTDASEEVREKFANTDMERQRRMLRQSLAYLVNYYASHNVDEFLLRIAVRHSRADLDIRPGLYDLWMEKLLETVAEFDRQFDEDVARGWRQVLAPGIAYMRSMYGADGTGN